MSFVKLEKQDHIAVVTINRPEALNALNTQVITDLSAVLDDVQKDDNIYVAIITGEGRSFVAGADIAEMRDLGAYPAKVFLSHGSKTFLKLENLKKPVIAAINGFCLGGGCELAMACDIRIASEKAKFGQPEVGLGIMPGFGGTQRLPRIVGVAKAMELILTGKTIGAAEAEQIGLVSYVYPPEELMAKAMELAQAIAANAQIAVQQCKLSIRVGVETTLDAGCALECQANAVCFSTEDKMEGMGAFLEKRAEKNFQYK
jgi:enoyl-CoA hydratase